MKPFKSGKGIANWLLRIALAFMLYHLYGNVIKTWEFTSQPFLIGSVAVILGILLLIGGMLSKPGLTIISGLAITILATYKIVVSFNGTLDHFLIAQFLPFALGFYFFSNGNDN